MRKEQVYTRVDLAERIKIIQGLVSDCERDKRKTMSNPSLNILRRFNKFDSLSHTKRKAFLPTFDALLKVQEG